MRENRDFSSWGSCVSCGAIMDGKLKDANMVMLSRRANKAYDSLGTAAAGDADGAPNMRAKHESLYTQRLMFTEDVAMNLAVLGETVDTGFEDTVDWKVSTALAVE